MNERIIVEKVKFELLKQLPGAVVFKLQDFMNSGIPDLVVSYQGRAVWVEVKLLRANETFSKFKKHFDLLQLATAQLLARQVPTYYFIAYDQGKNAVIAEPEVIRQFLTHEDPDIEHLPRVHQPIGAAIDYLSTLVRRPHETTV